MVTRTSKQTFTNLGSRERCAVYERILEKSRRIKAPAPLTSASGQALLFTMSESPGKASGTFSCLFWLLSKIVYV